MALVVEYNQINHLLCHFLSGPGLQSISKKIQLFQSSFSWRCDSPTYGFYACRFRCLVFCTCAGSSFFLSPSSTQFGLIFFYPLCFTLTSFHHCNHYFLITVNHKWIRSLCSFNSGNWETSEDTPNIIMWDNFIYLLIQNPNISCHVRLR